MMMISSVVVDFCGFALLVSFTPRAVRRFWYVLVSGGESSSPLRRLGVLGARVGGVRGLASGALLSVPHRIFGTEALVVQPIDFVRHAAAAEATLHNCAGVIAAKLSRQEPPRGPGSTSTQRQVNQAAAAAPAQAPRARHARNSCVRTPAAALPENAQNRPQE